MDLKRDLKLLLNYKSPYVRTKMSTDLILKDDNSAQLPAFMLEDAGMGTDVLQQYIVPPRIKIIQKNSGEPFTPRFTTGDVILSPLLVPVAGVLLDEQNRATKIGSAFHFVPLYFFPEWCTWNDYKMKGTLQAIRERSFDPESSIAIKSRTPETRQQPQPESPNNCKISHQQHLNFVVMLLEGEAKGVPAILTFVRAEHKSGSNLSGLIRLRKPAPIFGCVFEARTKFRANAQGDWYGLDVGNPSLESGFPSSVLNDGEYAAFKKLHLMYEEAHKKNLLVVDHEDDDLDLRGNAGVDM